MVKLDFSGSVVLVTGAGQGNGEAIARGFARAGGRVILADRNADTAKRAAQAIRDGGGDARAYELDVSDAAACSRLAERVHAEAGDVKVLVNNAGILIRAPFGQGKPLQDWDATLRVNLGGPYYMALAFADQLERAKGCILNVGSIQSFVATPNSAAYTASKGGVAQLTKALACELARRGVRVNAIAPGVIATPMTESTRSDPAKMAALLAHVPMKRYAQPDELIGPALFLCSELASYVTGTILPVDGGYLAS
ncbi:MAG: glucose 1-dehydrogenase [Burkholderiales bacterium]|nr:glucose 1-dehydrogenase [Burkholderiales bacterium]OJX06623.1 MAG: 3-oxoacyl-ACP reductase [Burkholderiales bacterium 70-64]